MNEERPPVPYEDVLPRGWKITGPVTGVYSPANDPDLDARKPHDRSDGWKQDPKVGGMRLRMWSQGDGWTQATVNFQLTNRGRLMCRPRPGARTARHLHLLRED